MIKIENVEVAGLEHAIRGIRNPKNSWDKSDSDDHVKSIKPDRLCNFKFYMLDTISALNNARELYLETKDKRFWWQMIQLLPSSYNQKRTIMLNYEVLAGMYESRKAHKLDEWKEFCKWIESLPYSELITGNE